MIAVPSVSYTHLVEYRQIGLLQKYCGDDEKLELLFDTLEAELLRQEDRFDPVMLKD